MGWTRIVTGISIFRISNHNPRTYIAVLFSSLGCSCCSTWIYGRKDWRVGKGARGRD